VVGKFCFCLFSIFEISQTMVQYRNKIVAALDTADTRLMEYAAFAGFPKLKSEKTRPRSIKRGAPGE
jgi:hypothetical protein